MDVTFNPSSIVIKITWMILRLQYFWVQSACLLNFSWDEIKKSHVFFRVANQILKKGQKEKRKMYLQF